MKNPVRAYYEANPLMVSSPFGGVDGLNHDLLAKVFDELGIDVAGRNVLDVGCGRAFLREVVAASHGRYTGVDLVASRPGGPDALADAARLPFRDGAFDALSCIDAFEHFPDPSAAAAEFRRVLRPDGFVFLSVPNYANVAGLVKKLYEATGRYRKDTWAPFRNWQPQELENPITPGQVRRLFGRAGFSHLRWRSHAPEVGLGLCPWIAHPRLPEALKFRLERAFGILGPAVVRVWPGASLHTFWKIEV